MTRSSPPYLLGPSSPHLRSYHQVFTCQSSPQEGQLWCVLIFHWDPKEGKGKQEDPAWLTWARWDPPNQVSLWTKKKIKTTHAEKVVYWLDPCIGGTWWRCRERISPLSFRTSPSCLRVLDFLHWGFKGWIASMAKGGCTGQWLNIALGSRLTSQFCFSVSPTEGKGLFLLCSLLFLSRFLLSHACSKIMLSCLYPSVTFSSTSSWHWSSPDPPPSICHPANSLSPSLWDSPLSIVCSLALSLPLFPSFVPFLLFIFSACFSSWNSAPHSSSCVFLPHPLPPPASFLLSGHLTPPLYPALSLPTLPRYSYLFLWLAILPSSILVVVWREWAPRHPHTPSFCASLIFLASIDKGEDTFSIVWKTEGMGETLIAGGLFLIISREKGASLVVHGRECLATQGTWVQTLVWKIQQAEKLLSPGTSTTELTPCNYRSLYS